MSIFKTETLFKSNKNAIYLILASFFFSLMTVCVKKIDYRIPILELVFFRSIFSLIVTSIIIKKMNINQWGVNKPLLILRGLFGTFALICIFYSIRNMPLSIATVIQYTYPIFISIFAGIFINEKLNLNLWLAVFLGWIGIFIILNPYNGSTFNDIRLNIVLVAFIGAICTSLAYVIVKYLSKKEDVFVIIKYFPFVSVMTLSPYVLTNWVMPTYEELIWILGIGIFTQSGQTFLTLGLKYLKASQAAAINYLQVFYASLWGIYLFEEEMTINFIAGSCLVLLGTIISSSKNIKKI